MRALRGRDAVGRVEKGVSAPNDCSLLQGGYTYALAAQSHRVVRPRMTQARGPVALHLRSDQGGKGRTGRRLTRAVDGSGRLIGAAAASSSSLVTGRARPSPLAGAVWQFIVERSARSHF